MPLLRNDSITDTAACNGTVSVHLSVGLCHLSTAVAACGGFASVSPTGRKYRSTAARPALSSNCEQCHVVSRRRKLNTPTCSAHTARCCSSMSVNWNVLVSVVVVFVVAVVVVGLLVSRYVRRRVRKLQLTADLQGVAVDNDEQDEVSSSSSCCCCCCCCRRYRRCLSSGVTPHASSSPQTMTIKTRSDANC